MTPQEQKQAARDFVAFWTDKGCEKGQTQPFWLSLIRVLGVERPETAIEFEDKAHIDSAHGFIDGYIPSTHVLVEQKSLGKNLRAGIRQSDGSVLSPFQQAKRYAVDLPYSLRPRWVVTCNFAEFDVHDMEKPNAEPERLLLANLPDELYRLAFLVDTGSENIRREKEISKGAGDVVGAIYDALLAQYRDPSNPASLKSLNELCVRLVFLLYAEDADVFRRLQFHDYLRRFPARDARRALVDLFRVLDTPPAPPEPAPPEPAPPVPSAPPSFANVVAATAQGILDARARHPDCSLKILYDELTMPPDLRRAHQENDRAVMAAYGFPKNMSESECVAELFNRYQALVAICS